MKTNKYEQAIISYEKGNERQHYRCQCCGELMLKHIKPKNCTYCYCPEVTLKKDTDLSDISSQEKSRKILDHLESLKGFDYFWDDVDDGIKDDIENAISDIITLTKKD